MSEQLNLDSILVWPSQLDDADVQIQKYHQYLAEQTAWDKTRCNKRKVIGDKNDPTLVECELEKGHAGQHQQTDPFGPPGQEGVRSFVYKWDDSLTLYARSAPNE